LFVSPRSDSCYERSVTLEELSGPTLSNYITVYPDTDPFRPRIASHLWSLRPRGSSSRMANRWDISRHTSLRRYSGPSRLHNRQRQSHVFKCAGSCGQSGCRSSGRTSRSCGCRPCHRPSVVGRRETGSVLNSEAVFGVTAVAYLSQHLIVPVDQADLVANLHHAFRRPTDAIYPIFLHFPTEGIAAISTRVVTRRTANDA